MVETRVIGHMLVPIEIHLQKKKHEIKKKNIIDIYFCEKKIANVYLWGKWKEILDIKINDRLSNFLFEPTFRYIIKKRNKKFLIPFKHNANIWNHHLFIKGEAVKDDSLNDMWEMYDSPHLLEQTSPLLKLTTAEKNFGEKILKKTNILKDDNIILLVVRDSAYWEHIYPEKILTKTSNRDSDIDDFKGLVKDLCEKNYKVIRMGRIMHKKLNYKHDNFIDYAFCDFKSEFMDVFLFSVTKFIISTGSGLETISNLFRKKMLYLNFADLDILHCPLNSNLTFVYPKKIIDKTKNKELSIYDIFRYRLDNAHGQKSDYRNNLTWNSITPEEMINATKEMIDYLDNKYLDSSLETNREINNLLQDSYAFENTFYWSRDFLEKKINRN
jgi:putative glycosyltransferase (TIGR04372 family)